MSALRGLLARPGLTGAALLIGACVALGACDRGPAGPTAGTVQATVTGAGADDEAVLLELTGQVTSVTAARADVEVSARPHTGGYTVAVFGPLAAGPVLTIAVPDRTRPPAATVREVSDTTGTLRPALAQYGVRLESVQ